MQAKQENEKLVLRKFRLLYLYVSLIFHTAVKLVKKSRQKKHSLNIQPCLKISIKKPGHSCKFVKCLIVLEDNIFFGAETESVLYVAEVKMSTALYLVVPFGSIDKVVLERQAFLQTYSRLGVYWSDSSGWKTWKFWGLPSNRGRWEGSRWRWGRCRCWWWCSSLQDCLITWNRKHNILGDCPQRRTGKTYYIQMSCSHSG